MPNEFTWFPDTGHSLSEEPKVEVIRFGDGYEARVQKGMNANPEKWSLQFSKTRVEAGLILDFLRQCGATKPFTWKNPLSKTNTYICRNWKTSIDKGLVQITCDFEQVFEKVI